jgi:hypothetical protein
MDATLTVQHIHEYRLWIKLNGIVDWRAFCVMEELKIFYTKLPKSMARFSMAPLYMAVGGVGGQPGQQLDRQSC